MEAVQVFSDPEQIKEILAKGKITDIAEFIKAQAKANPDLVKDPAKFEEQWNRSAGGQAVAELKQNEADRIGTRKSELAEILEKHSPGLAEAFAELTPKDKLYGQLAGKLSFAVSVDQVEKIFNWGEVEIGAFTWRDRCLALMQAVELMGTLPQHYRGMRKIFLEAIKDNTIEIKPEYLQASSATEAIQKAVCAKMAKASSNEDIETIFDWAEVELQKQLLTADKFIVFCQIAEMMPFDEARYRTIRRIFVRMNKA
jgi:hypothetical protein